MCQRVGCDDISLASICSFVKYIAKNCQIGEHSCLWVAAVSWYMPHNCAVWFGKPIQVWTTVTYPGYNLVSIKNIKSRVLYTQAEVNFGRLIGKYTVNVVVPLNNNM